MTVSHGNCRHLLADLSDYLDGDAPAALCAEIERHMADCRDCRAVVETLRKTVALYRNIPEAALDAEIRARLHRSLNLAEYLPQTSL